jgi:hypothetical protein
MIGLADCALDHWSPKLGDPGLMGWVTVAVYLMAAAAAAAVAWRGQPATRRTRERLFWALAATLLLLLAVNKQLDLQTFLTELARCHAETHDWYEQRRIIQRDFILAIAAGGLAVIYLLRRMLRGTLRRTGVALVGLGFVTTFVVIRATSFHYTDVLVNTYVFGVRVSGVLEIVGPVLVLLNAQWLLIRSGRSR